MIEILICLLLGYLIGSINTSIVYSKLKKTDIRNYGSKNAGATNTLRIFGKKAAIVVFACDVLKGVIAVFIAKCFAQSDIAIYASGFGCILGHNFPLYFNFKGGKGVATSFAIMLAINAKMALLIFIVFAIVVAISKYVSLASICAAVSLPIFSIIFKESIEFTILCLMMSALAIFKHKTNIVKLINKTENKLGRKMES